MTKDEARKLKGGERVYSIKHEMYGTIPWVNRNSNDEPQAVRFDNIRVPYYCLVEIENLEEK